METVGGTDAEGKARGEDGGRGIEEDAVSSAICCIRAVAVGECEHGEAAKAGWWGSTEDAASSAICCIREVAVQCSDDGRTAEAVGEGDVSVEEGSDVCSMELLEVVGWGDEEAATCDGGSIEEDVGEAAVCCV